MKNDFYNVLNKSRRKIVIHHCHLIDDINVLLNNDDLVFFDDCLYSQYVFIRDNISKLKSKNINCILGFSTSLYRNQNQDPIYDINSAELHDRIHNNDVSALNGFMSLDELHHLLSYDNVYLACHGNNHLQLEKICNTQIEYVRAFTDDVFQATKKLQSLNLSTQIFVYPYAFDFFLSNKILDKYGYKYIFAGKNAKRIEIERLVR